MATTKRPANRKTTSKTEVKQQLNGEAKAPIKNTEDSKVTPISPMVELAQRIEKFEQMKGLCDQRERLTKTLSDLQRFNYHSNGDALFYLRSSDGNKEFKSSNSNLIQLVSELLQKTLETRREELNSSIMAFRL